ncbi:MAG: hypothetical protein JWN71_925 [Xanthobacteraceae bacterium]|jgi:hypothetical protein|nr:hypothetical protein [Xanthobacteraceae bacterium]
MGRILFSLFLGVLVAAFMLAALRYFDMPYEGTWVVGVAGVIAALVWMLMGKKA